MMEPDEARALLSQGKIIAYPTEAVYGLGCDPFNEQAVNKLLVLKQRAVDKGLILLISNWSQLSSLIRAIPSHLMEDVKKTWPGPVTWLFPKAASIPYWISGEHESVAIRMSAHPIAQKLSSDGPIVSTSANVSSQEPAIDKAGIMAQFPSGLDAIVSGHLGGASQPSAIYDVVTGQKFR